MDHPPLFPPWWNDLVRDSPPCFGLIDDFLIADLNLEAVFPIFWTFSTGFYGNSDSKSEMDTYLAPPNQPMILNIVSISPTVFLGFQKAPPVWDFFSVGLVDFDTCLRANLHQTCWRKLLCSIPKRKEWKSSSPEKAKNVLEIRAFWDLVNLWEKWYCRQIRWQLAAISPPFAMYANSDSKSEEITSWVANSVVLLWSARHCAMITAFAWCTNWRDPQISIIFRPQIGHKIMFQTV